MALIRDKFCLNCEIKETGALSGLKTCSRCLLAWYCTKKCQNEAFSDHKEFCKAVKEQRDNLEQMEKKLKSCRHGSRNQVKNLFETSVGEFWQIFTNEAPQPRDYIRAR
jgi:hypothetical protein